MSSAKLARRVGAVVVRLHVCRPCSSGARRGPFRNYLRGHTQSHAYLEGGLAQRLSASHPPSRAAALTSDHSVALLILIVISAVSGLTALVTLRRRTLPQPAEAS